jgi:hypothetical protein
VPCIGCHIAVSPDGKRIVDAGMVGPSGAIVALGEPAAALAISPDGHVLVYAAMAAAEANNPTGTALRVRPWNAATAAVGPAITVATAAGVLRPSSRRTARGYSTRARPSRTSAG